MALVSDVREYGNEHRDCSGYRIAIAFLELRREFIAGDIHGAWTCGECLR